MVNAVEVFEDRYLGFTPYLPVMPPDQFSFDGLQERLDRHIAQQAQGIAEEDKRSAQ